MNIKLTYIDIEHSRIFYNREGKLYYFEEEDSSSTPSKFNLYANSLKNVPLRPISYINVFIDAIDEPFVPRNPAGAALVKRFWDYILHERSLRRTYTVNWSVDIEPDQAKDPRTAAMIAQRMQQTSRPDYDVGVFNLTDQYGEEYVVDLNEEVVEI